MKNIEQQVYDAVDQETWHTIREPVFQQVMQQVTGTVMDAVGIYVRNPVGNVAIQMLQVARQRNPRCLKTSDLTTVVRE